MIKTLPRRLGLALGALATTSLGGCYYGDVNGYGTSYASNDCSARYGDSYYDTDPYAYDDGYGYDCYDSRDYGGGFVQIGFGGGWYDNYYYPGYGLWLFDSYRNRYPLRGQYLNYWGGRRAWWQHHGRRGDGQWNGGGHDGRPRGDGRPGRPRGADGRDHDGDGPRGTRPGGRPGAGNGHDTHNPPAASDPGRPGGWNGRDRDDDRPRGTRPDRRPQTGSDAAPATGTVQPPRRPDRSPGAGRPAPPSDGNSAANRPRPQRPDRVEESPMGADAPRRERAPGDVRPMVRQPLPAARVAPVPVARAAPPAAVRQPLPTARVAPAPVVRAAPPPAAVAPPARPLRVERPMRERQRDRSEND